MVILNKAAVLKLRNRENVKLYNSEQKIYTQLQLNKKEKFICWERWQKRPGGNWVNQNLYLSLKDCVSILNEIVNSKKNNITV